MRFAIEALVFLVIFGFIFWQVILPMFKRGNKKVIEANKELDQKCNCAKCIDEKEEEEK